MLDCSDPDATPLSRLLMFKAIRVAAFTSFPENDRVENVQGNMKRLDAKILVEAASTSRSATDEPV